LPSSRRRRISAGTEPGGSIIGGTCARRRGTHPRLNVVTTPDNVLGMFSLRFRMLIPVISARQLAHVLRTDNRGGWRLSEALIFPVGFLAIDLGLLASNLLEIPDGGCLPLLIRPGALSRDADLAPRP
jgi:K+ transporter